MLVLTRRLFSLALLSGRTMIHQEQQQQTDFSNDYLRTIFDELEPTKLPYPIVSSSSEMLGATRRQAPLSSAVQEEKRLSLASPSEVKVALQDPRTVVVDTRGVDDIVTQGHVKPDMITEHRQLQHDSTVMMIHPWVNAPCTLEGCPLLNAAAKELLPDKTAPVLLYCATGKRSMIAKRILEGKGYTNVLVLGGYPKDTRQYFRDTDQ